MKDALKLIIGFIVIIGLCVGGAVLDGRRERAEWNNGYCRHCGADVVPVQSQGGYASQEDNDWYCPKCHRWN